MKFITLTILTCLLAAAPAQSEILRVPDDYDSIQEAIDAARNGDEVRVAPGEYEENIEFTGLNILVIGNPEDPSETIIDGNENASVVQFTDRERDLTQLNGFTLRNGRSRGAGGGGIYCRNSSPTLRNLIITDNFGNRGGGILCEDSNPRIFDVSLIDNTSQAHGGGICLIGSSSPVMTDVHIYGNQSESTDGGGVASYSRGRPEIRGGIIRNNESQRNGGGLFSQGNMILIDVSIDSNSTEGRGGGLYSNGNITLTRVRITDNSAEGNGGGVFINSVGPRFTRVLVAGNETDALGGGFYLSGDVAGRCNPDLINVTLADNQASDDGGGGIYCNDNSNPTLLNCIVWGNEPQGVQSNGEGDENSVTVSYTDFENGRDGIVTNNNADINWGDGNIDSDPLFEDAERRDYNLTWDNYPEDDETKSPCIDAGNPDLGEDDDGTRVDMGVYFFSQAFPSISVEPMEVEFGAVELEEQADRLVIISNQGDAWLFGNLTISQEDSVFSIREADEEIDVEPGEDYRAVVSFRPTERIIYRAALVIEHNDPERQAVRVTLIGHGMSLPPVVERPLLNLTIREDDDWITIADLDTVFSDPDEDTLTYFVQDDVPYLNINIDENSVLALRPDADFSAPGINIVVNAVDTDGSGITDDFLLNIEPMNDAPALFSLLQPRNNEMFGWDTVSFIWEEAEQNQWELDEVVYTLFFRSDTSDLGEPFPLDTFLIEGLQEPHYLDMSIRWFIEQSGFEMGGCVAAPVFWWVEAHDDSSVTVSREEWEFGLATGSVNDNIDEIPGEFYLYQNYPNPFNRSTYFKFGVRNPAYLELMIYDVQGKIVTEFEPEFYNPGLHELRWDAGNLESGIYFLRLRNHNYSSVRQMLYLR